MSRSPASGTTCVGRRSPPPRRCRASDGTFHRTVDAAATADPAEAVAEAHAQADRATAVGLDITYIDPHMGVSVRAAYEAMCARFGVKFIYRAIEPHHEWASLIVLSLAPFEDRGAWLAEQLESIGPGTHFVLSHPAVESAELARDHRSRERERSVGRAHPHRGPRRALRPVRAEGDRAPRHRSRRGTRPALISRGRTDPRRRRSGGLTLAR